MTEFERKLEELFGEAEEDSTKMAVLSKVITKNVRTVTYDSRDGSYAYIVFSDRGVANEYYRHITEDFKDALEDALDRDSESWKCLRNNVHIPNDLVDDESFLKYKNDLSVMKTFYCILRQFGSPSDATLTIS